MSWSHSNVLLSLSLLKSYFIYLMVIIGLTRVGRNEDQGTVLQDYEDRVVLSFLSKLLFSGYHVPEADAKIHTEPWLS